MGLSVGGQLAVHPEVLVQIKPLQPEDQAETAGYSAVNLVNKQLL